MRPPGLRPAVTRGVVAAFDPVAGLGTLSTDDGQEIGFHCTQITDGSRVIPVGGPVEFVVLAGRHGRWEAGALRSPPGAPGPGATSGG